MSIPFDLCMTLLVLTRGAISDRPLKSFGGFTGLNKTNTILFLMEEFVLLKKILQKKTYKNMNEYKVKYPLKGIQKYIHYVHADMLTS